MVCSKKSCVIIEIALDAEFQGQAPVYSQQQCHMRAATGFDNCRQGRNDRRHITGDCSIDVHER